MRNNNGGSRGRSRKHNEADANREGSFVWNPKQIEVLLELVNNELKAKGYTMRLPDNSGKRRVEEKFHERIGIKVKWEPHIKSRLDYMRKLWQHNNILINRTGISVNPLTGKIEMSDEWWSDRIAESGKNNGKYIKVLQNKALPFKELLDQIYGEHDLEQDDRYSPHTMRINIEESFDAEVNNDDMTLEETQEDNESQSPEELPSDDEFSRPSQAAFCGTRERTHSSPPRASKSNLGVRKKTTKRTKVRRINFENQVQNGFQCLEESRTSLLDVLRSRHNSKATFGDALAVLESLAVQPMGKFWWAASTLLMNDEDIRDGFVKLRNEENKIQFLEKLTGFDRDGYQCDNINLRGSSSFTTPLSSTFTQMAGINTNASSSFCHAYGNIDMSSTGTTFTSLLGGAFANTIGETRSNI